MKLDDLTGRTFGQLQVICRAQDHITDKGHWDSQYFCKCDCGEGVIVMRKNLISGHTKSCGCIRRKKGTALPEKKRVKGCLYNRQGIMCVDQKCSTCGWNPTNTKLRKKRLKNLTGKDA